MVDIFEEGIFLDGNVLPNVIKSMGREVSSDEMEAELLKQTGK